MQRPSLESTEQWASTILLFWLFDPIFGSCDNSIEDIVKKKNFDSRHLIPCQKFSWQPNSPEQCDGTLNVSARLYIGRPRCLTKIA